MLPKKDNKFSVLIVDDTPSNIRFLGTLLMENNYEAEFAMQGEEALEWLKHRDFDLILLDIMMPNMDGYETCKKIKQMDGKSEIPIIFLTAKISQDDIIKGFEAGAVDYITKPFNSTELLLRINTHIQLQFQKKQLKESNSTKDKFLSIIAHDLMNPMSAILTFSEFLQQSLETGDLELSEIHRKYLHESAKNSFDLLQNLLSWGRIQSGRINFSPKEFFFNDMMSEVIENVNSQALGKNIQIMVSGNTGFLITADYNMISTVLRNLLSNAIKFSFPESKIYFRVIEKDDFYECIIEDNGVGLSEKKLANLFHIQNNKSTVGTNKEMGTGLGLLLVKEFIDLHQGYINVESIEGKGSTFSIGIPTKYSIDNSFE